MIANIQRSLVDILGGEYLAAVCRAESLLSGRSYEELWAIANEKVDFYPETFARRQEELGQKGHADVIQMEADLADRQYDLTNTYNMY